MELTTMKGNIPNTCYVFFSTLSKPTRLAILELLRSGPKNVTEIAETLNQEQSTISHNLRSLENCGFVFSERKKKEHFYSLNKETMEPLFKLFMRHATKYCDTKGKCVVKDLRKRSKEAAAKSLFLSRH